MATCHSGPCSSLCSCPAADAYVACYTLGRRAFHELLGPIESVWRYETLRKVGWCCRATPVAPAWDG